MTLKQLQVDVFLERVREMPDIEAKEQIEMRREALSLEYNLLMAERERLAPMVRAGDRAARAEHHQIGVALVTIGYDMGVLRVALKEVNERMSRLAWGRAVTAVFGQEGYAQCREWMEANR